MNTIILKLTTSKYHITLPNIITNEKDKHIITKLYLTTYNHLF